MMRILQGTLKNKRLPAHDTWVRPTSAFKREMIFNRLAHTPDLFDRQLSTCRVLDVFAGTGALGLEALSRGAAYVAFIESQEKTAAKLDKFLKENSLNAQTHLFKEDTRNLSACPLPPFHLCFLDAPYKQGLLPQTLEALHRGKWLCPHALCVAETDAQERLAFPDVVTILDYRIKGHTAFWFLKYRV